MRRQMVTTMYNNTHYPHFKLPRLLNIHAMISYCQDLLMCLLITKKQLLIMDINYLR